MPVTAKKLSREWRKAFADFERLSGFEMMHQDDVDAREMTPQQAWDANISWLEGMLAEVTNIQTPFEQGTPNG